MARPIKAGVDYFPHDTNTVGKKTLFTLESRFGNDGYAFWFKLLEILGTQDGLFYDCNKPADWLFLTAKTRVDEDTATEILNTLAQVEAIDPELWTKKIIWVQKFVDRLNEVYRKRSTEIPSKPSFRDENSSTANNTDTITPQSKVNKTIEKDSTGESPPTPSGESAAPSIQEKRFDEFWANYPKKTGKQAAFKSWQRIKPDAALHDRIMTAVGKAKATEQWQRENGRFIPNPTTWLNQGRWDDEYKEVNTYGTGISQQHTEPNGAGTFTLSGFKPAKTEGTEYGHDPLAGFKRD